MVQILDGCVSAIKKKPVKGKAYWDAIVSTEANIRLEQLLPTHNMVGWLSFLRGHKSPHEHPPDQEECAVESVRANIKRKAENEPHLPRPQILRLKLPDVAPEVLPQLPERENMKKV